MPWTRRTYYEIQELLRWSDQVRLLSMDALLTASSASARVTAAMRRSQQLTDHSQRIAAHRPFSILRTR